MHPGARASVFVGMLVVLVACSGTPTSGPGAGETEAGGGQATEDVFADVLAEVEGLTGQERRDRLIELAGEAGDVSLYTSLNSDIANELVSAFEDDTGIGVELYRASNETLAQRLPQEVEAGTVGADVIETDGVTMAALDNDGFIRPYEPPNLDELAEGVMIGGWTADRFNIFTVAWNTNLVSEGERPTTYQDLANPVWDGRLAMEPGDYDWFMSVYTYLVEDKGLSEKEADQVFSDMATGAAFVKGHSNTRQQVIAGEYAIAASDYSYGVQAALEAGAPIAWQPSVEPLFARPNGVGLVPGGPNPAGGVLFHDWLLSDGQEVLKKLAIDPVRTDLVDTSDADIRVVDVQEYLEQEEMWSQKYDTLTRLGEIVEE